jgi:hypothetical protein
MSGLADLLHTHRKLVSGLVFEQSRKLALALRRPAFRMPDYGAPKAPQYALRKK